MELLYGQPVGGFVVFTDGDGLQHAVRFGSMLPDADDQQDAGHADDAFGGTSRILARPKPIEHADYSFHCPARTGRTDRLWRRHLMRLPDGSAAF